MLARTLGPKFDTFPCFVQPKLNGVRALFQQPIGKFFGSFQSRDEKIWKSNVLKHLNDELNTLQPVLMDTILDGELYVHGWRLQRINAAIAVNRHEPTPDTPNVEFHIFDVVDPQRTFATRWFEIYNTIKDANLPHIKAVPTAVCTARNELDLHFHHYVKLGYEGIMLRPDGVYQYGEHYSRSNTHELEPTLTSFRSRYLWKHKQWEDGEYICEGVTQGEGKADIGIGALILRAPTHPELSGDGQMDEVYKTFKVGTGFTDVERVQFMVKPPIGKLVKVRYLNLTADGIPFNPSFLAVLS